MSDTPQNSPLISVSFARRVEEMAKVLNRKDMKGFLDEILLVYATVAEELPDTRGKELILHLTESLFLRKLAVGAASEGRSLASVDNLGGGNYGVGPPFLPGSLVEMRDDALEERDRKATRIRDKYANTANANKAAPADT